MDIEKVLNEKLAELISSGAIESKLQDCLESSIDKAINDAVKGYGGLRCSIEKYIKEGLSLNLCDVPFEVYNKMIAEELHRKIKKNFVEDKFQVVLDTVSGILEPAPKTIDIHEFVDKVIELEKSDWLEYHECDDFVSVELITESSDRYSLKIWRQKNSSLYSSSSRTNSPTLEFCISKTEGIRIAHRSYYNPTCMFNSAPYTFKLYSAGTVITGLDDFDEDNCDLSLRCEY